MSTDRGRTTPAHADTPVGIPIRGAAAVGSSARGLVSLLLYYFVGVDQGATSIFGADTHIHEFVHDARHFLGFPCH